MAPASMVERYPGEQHHQGKPSPNPGHRLPANTALVTAGTGTVAPWQRQDSSEQGWVVTGDAQLFSHLLHIYFPGARPAAGKGQMLSDVTLPPLPRQERSSLLSTGRGGEEGREGRTTTALGRQTACSLLPWGLGLLERRCPKPETGSCHPRAQQDRTPYSTPWATPDSSHGDVPQDPQQAETWTEPPQSNPSQEVLALIACLRPYWGAPHPASPTHPSLSCTPPACPHPRPTHPSLTIPFLPLLSSPPHMPLPRLLPQPHTSLSFRLLALPHPSTVNSCNPIPICHCLPITPVPYTPTYIAVSAS